MLRGKGHIGTFCPHCGGELEYIKYDVSGEYYWERWQCSECEAAFIVLFKAVEWKEDQRN